MGFFATGGGGWQWLVAGCWGWLLPTVCVFFYFFYFWVGGSDLQDVVFGGSGWTLEINNKEILKK